MWRDEYQRHNFPWPLRWEAGCEEGRLDYLPASRIGGFGIQLSSEPWEDLENEVCDMIDNDNYTLYDVQNLIRQTAEAAVLAYQTRDVNNHTPLRRAADLERIVLTTANGAAAFYTLRDLLISFTDAIPDTLAGRELEPCGYRTDVSETRCGIPTSFECRGVSPTGVPCNEFLCWKHIHCSFVCRQHNQNNNALNWPAQVRPPRLPRHIWRRYSQDTRLRYLQCPDWRLAVLPGTRISWEWCDGKGRCCYQCREGNVGIYRHFEDPGWYVPDEHWQRRRHQLSFHELLQNPLLRCQILDDRTPHAHQWYNIVRYHVTFCLRRCAFFSVPLPHVPEWANSVENTFLQLPFISSREHANLNTLCERLEMITTAFLTNNSNLKGPVRARDAVLSLMNAPLNCFNARESIPREFPDLSVREPNERRDGRHLRPPSAAAHVPRSPSSEVQPPPVNADDGEDEWEVDEPVDDGRPAPQYPGLRSDDSDNDLPGYENAMDQLQNQIFQVEERRK